MRIYFLIGFIYCMINIVVRENMNEHKDPMVVLGWTLFWPFFFVPLIFSFINRTANGK